MERKLKIYRKNPGFQLGIEYIILFGLLFTYFLLLFSNSFHEPPSESLNDITTLVGVIMAVYAVVFMIANIFRHERLYGKLQGSLILENERVIIDSKSYYIDDILKITIAHHDIKGDFVNALLEFKPKRSNGVKNYVQLELRNGDIVRSNYLQTKQERIQMFRDEIHTYFRFNLIHRQNYLNIVNAN